MNNINLNLNINKADEFQFQLAQRECDSILEDIEEYLDLSGRKDMSENKS